MQYTDEPIDPSRFNLSPTERLAAWVNAHWLALVVGSAALGTFVVWALLLVARVCYGASMHWIPTGAWAMITVPSVAAAINTNDMRAGLPIFVVTCVLVTVMLLAGSTAAEVFS